MVLFILASGPTTAICGITCTHTTMQQAACCVLRIACDHARKGGDKQLRACCFVTGSYTYQPSKSHLLLEGLHALSLSAASCTTARCQMALDTLSWPNTCLARHRDVLKASFEECLSPFSSLQYRDMPLFHILYSMLCHTACVLHSTYVLLDLCCRTQQLCTGYRSGSI